MRKLEYIKLFEAFESDKLSKTLKFVKKNKSYFLSAVKSICNTIDFPYSDLSDDQFEYLPFNAALKKSSMMTDQPCDATSIGNFGRQHGVEGEVCNNGVIKRKWGRGFRNVTCDSCSGTGVKQKTGEAKLVKFWFTKDGEYILPTCVDGLVRERTSERLLIPNSRAHYIHNKGVEIIKPEADFREKVRSLQTGQYVFSSVRGGEVYGIIYNDGRGNVFIVHNNSNHPMNGNHPRNASINGYPYTSYGRYCWQVDGGTFTTIKPVTRKIEDDDNEPDPYTWNSDLIINNARVYTSGRDIKSGIINAHFALIMDFSKMKSVDFIKMSSTRTSRRDSKQGALALLKNDDIKSQNINRYISELSKRFNVNPDLGNIKSIIIKLLGGKNGFYYTRGGYAKESINSILNAYVGLMSDDEDSRNYHLDNLNRKLKERYEVIMEYNKNINNNLKTIIDKIKKSPFDREYLDKYLEVISLLEKFGIAVRDKVDNMEIETLDDMEILYQKLLTIKNFMTNSRMDISKIGGFIDYLGRTSDAYSYDYLVRNRGDLDSICESIKRIITLINRV